MFVLVVDKNRKPLNPCHPARARKFLKEGRAVVLRRYPFTILLKDTEEEESSEKPEYRLKLDPGSKTTGIAILKEDKVIWAAELNHRGFSIRQSLESRRALRRGRRSRHTRYRQPRCNNRKRPECWLPPSLQHRVLTTLTWVNRLRRFCPISVISMELVRFDTQLMQDPVKQPLVITATGHGTRQMCRTDKYGLPSRYVPRNKFVRGFQTGDIVKAVVTSGKKIGTYVGRVAVRSSGSFNIKDKTGLIQGISHKFCSRVHGKDGYHYCFN